MGFTDLIEQPLGVSLRMQVGSVLKAAKRLANRGGEIEPRSFKERAGISEKSFYNVLKELRLLGIAEVVNGKLRLLIGLPSEDDTFEVALRTHLKERLRRNRLVWHIVERLNTEPSLPLDDVASVLARACPYVSAEQETWRTYSRVFADWMDFSDLAVFDSRSSRLLAYKPGREVRQRGIGIGVRRRDTAVLPSIQYSPVIEVARRIVTALSTGARLNFSGLKPSTISKSLATLEDLGFVVRKTGTLTVTPKMAEFARAPEGAADLFRAAVLQLDGFDAFAQILKDFQVTGATHLTLGRNLSRRLGYEWKDGTATTVAKVLLDWARHTGVAPSAFGTGRRRATPTSDEPSLFDE